MKGKTVTRKQKISGIIITFPFLLAIILLILGHYTLNDIYLYKDFRISILAITIIAFAHISSVIILLKFDKIEMQLPPSRLKKKLLLIILIIMTFMFSFLLEMGLRMNLNYWLKSSVVENIELVIVEKYISQGRGTDRYIIFNSNEGRFTIRVRLKIYESLSIGEKFKAKVNKGFIEGYFLTEPLK